MGTTRHNTTQHNTSQHNTTQRNATQRNATQHSTAQHSTAQHGTAQHSTAKCSAGDWCLKTPATVRCAWPWFLLQGPGMGVTKPQTGGTAQNKGTRSKQGHAVRKVRVAARAHVTPKKNPGRGNCKPSSTMATVCVKFCAEIWKIFEEPRELGQLVVNEL